MKVAVFREAEGVTLLEHAEVGVIACSDDPLSVWLVTERPEWSPELRRWYPGESRNVTHRPTGLSPFTRHFTRREAVALMNVLDTLVPHYGSQWTGGVPETFAAHREMLNWLRAKQLKPMLVLEKLRVAMGEGR